jgi:PAS domain S-box-containing protein
MSKQWFILMRNKKRKIKKKNRNKSRISKREMGRKEKENFKALVENAGDSVFVVSKEEKIVYANKKAARMTGYKRERLLGKSIGILLFGDEFKKIAEMLKKRMKGESTPGRYESSFVVKSGKRISIEISATLIQWYGQPASFALVRDITKQKKAEEALEEEEVRLDTLIDNLPCLVWFKDKKSRYIKINREFGEKAGFLLSKKIIGKKTEEVWPLKLAKQYKSEDRMIIKTGKIINTEEVITKENKEDIFYEAIKGPIRNKRGKILGVFGINHDITKYRLAEKALTESHQEYQDLVENINDIIFHLDSKGKFIYINPVVKKITGYKPEEIIGHSFDSFVHPHDLPGVKVSMKDAMSGNVYPYELRVICKNGSIINIRSFGRPLRKKGRIVGVIGLIKDITGSNKMKEALKDSEEKLRNIVSDLPMLICRFLPDGKITFVNENYCKYFGKKKENLLGRKFFSLLSAKNRPIVEKRFFLLTPESSFLNYEYQSKNAKGEYRWQDWTNRAIFDKKGQVMAYQTIGKDITEKKESQDKLIESYRYLGTINRQISILLGLNDVFEEKNKDKITNSILWSALEISSSRFAALYKCDKKNERFHLRSIVSKKKINEDQKSDIAVIFSKSDKFFKFISNNGNKVFKCPRQFQLKNIEKIDDKIKCYSILPLIEKGETKGLLILGSSSKKELNDQEKNFYKIFSMYAALLLLDLGEIG